MFKTKTLFALLILGTTLMTVTQCQTTITCAVDETIQTGGGAGADPNPARVLQSSCVKCSIKYEECRRCNPEECTRCTIGRKFKENDDGLKECSLDLFTLIFWPLLIITIIALACIITAQQKKERKKMVDDARTKYLEIQKQYEANQAGNALA